MAGFPEDDPKPTLLMQEDKVLQRVRELTRNGSLRRMSLDELLSRAPNDWQPGEADVDEFLASIRGRGEEL